MLSTIAQGNNPLTLNTAIAQGHGESRRQLTMSLSESLKHIHSIATASESAVLSFPGESRPSHFQSIAPSFAQKEILNNDSMRSPLSDALSLHPTKIPDTTFLPASTKILLPQSQMSSDPHFLSGFLCLPRRRDALSALRQWFGRWNTLASIHLEEEMHQV